jgi:type II secretory pathway component GspD/PulD (secretin)
MRRFALPLGLAVLAAGCAQHPWTRYDHESIHLEVRARARPAARAALPGDGAGDLAAGPARLDVPMDLAALSLGPTRRLQIDVEARLVEVTNRDLSILGIEWVTPQNKTIAPMDLVNTTPSSPKFTIGTGIGTTIGGGGGGQGRYPDQPSGGEEGGGFGGIGVGTGVGMPVDLGGPTGVTSISSVFYVTGGLDGAHISVLIRTLQQDSGRVLARPVILTVSGREAIVAAGETPMPTTEAREAQTRVLVRGDETIVLGGMVQDANTDTRNKVPMLADIPFVKHLFKSTGNKVQKLETLIFVTPKIIIQEGE